MKRNNLNYHKSSRFLSFFHAIFRFSRVFQIPWLSKACGRPGNDIKLMLIIKLSDEFCRYPFKFVFVFSRISQFVFVFYTKAVFFLYYLSTTAHLTISSTTIKSDNKINVLDENSEKLPSL